MTIARRLDDKAVSVLKSGGRVLLLLPPASVKTDCVLGFSTVFWNTAWTRNQPPHTLGILCDPTHPALKGFPTEYHTNWQWWELIHGAAAMTLDGLPAELHPIVQPIDTWFEARRLGLVFEAKVAGGRLLVCSMDLQNDLADRPVARQMRKCLLDYAAGEAFSPRVEIDVEAIRALSRPLSPLQELGATVSADDAQSGYPADSAIDGDPATMWHTRWGQGAAKHPHWLVIDLKKPCTVAGLTCLPRQDQSNGRIDRFAIFLSPDGQTWNEPVASGQWANDREMKVARFPSPQTARYVKLEAQSEVRGQTFASAAEIGILLEKEP